MDIQPSKLVVILRPEGPKNLPDIQPSKLGVILRPEGPENLMGIPAAGMRCGLGEILREAAPRSG